MAITKLTLTDAAFPARLQQLTSPPKQIYIASDCELNTVLKRPVVGVIGARAVTPYGRLITERIVRELAEQGIVIVSGMALGVDGIAHRAALTANGITIAVLPGPVSTPFPTSHRQLAASIIAQGGALISEYADNEDVYKPNFVARNRIVAGLSDVLLITEAGVNSGSLHTARFMLDIGREVLAVPGPITSNKSEGTHNLLKSGAALVTSSDDVLLALGLTKHTATLATIHGSNEHEQAVLDALLNGEHDGQVLMQLSGLDVGGFNSMLTALELHGKIRRLGNNQWALR